MTPEQRETWKEHQERLYAMAVDDGETWDLSANDQAACNAGGDAIMALLDRAALAPPPTCGTCKWGVEVFTEHAPPDEVFCQRFSGRRKRDDGCIKGYTPTEPTR